LLRWGNWQAALPRRSRIRYLLGILAGTALPLILVVGIAGPEWGQEPAPPAMQGSDIVVVLDMSRSMLAQDVLGQSSPNRFGKAVDAATDLANAVERRGRHRLALVAFASRARLVCPLTHDCDHFREVLSQLKIGDPLLEIGPQAQSPTSGTRIGEGLLKAVAACDTTEQARSQILLLSDGDDPVQDGEWQEGAAAAALAGVGVWTVGLGDPERGSRIPVGEDRYLTAVGKPVLTRLEEQPLAEIARRTGGAYIPARTDSFSMDEVFLPRLEASGTQEKGDDALVVPVARYGAFFGVAFILLAGQIVYAAWPRRKTVKNARVDVAGGQRWRPLMTAAIVLLAALLTGGFFPEDTSSLILQGDRAFEREDYAAALEAYTRAEERTTDPGLVAFNKGAVLYHLGRFHEATLNYSRCLGDATGARRARALYDLGNALVQESRGRDAGLLRRGIRYYEECLQQPGQSREYLDNVAFNRDLARALLAQAKESAQGGQDRGSMSRQSQDKRRDSSRQQTRAGERSQVEIRNSEDIKRAGTQPENRADKEQTATTQPRPPGMGDLPPISDAPDGNSPTAEEAAAYIEMVASRVLTEHREQKARLAGPLPPGVKDW
jgi:Ca-activated chloride channel family protein